MESESPEKSHLRFSEEQGLLVYEGEFSPDLPLGWVEPSRFAPPRGDVALGSLPRAEREGRNSLKLAPSQARCRFLDYDSGSPYFVSRPEAMDGRKNIFSASMSRKVEFRQHDVQQFTPSSRFSERHSKTVPVRAFR
jgi:hypothetical protein